MSDTPSAPCGVGGFGFVPIAIDHHKIPDELRGDVDRLLDRLGIANAYIDALEARVAELEARNAQLQSELDHAKARANELQAETLRLEDLAKHRGKLMEQAVDQSRDLEACVAEMEGRKREAEESNANALARLSAAEARIELRRVENEAVRRQLGHAENACDAMEKRVAELEARCKRMQEIGDMIVDEYMVERAERDAWQQAKEAKP